jgi:hypothetical protein
MRWYTVRSSQQLLLELRVPDEALLNQELRERVSHGEGHDLEFFQRYRFSVFEFCPWVSYLLNDLVRPSISRYRSASYVRASLTGRNNPCAFSPLPQRISLYIHLPGSSLALCSSGFR